MKLLNWFLDHYGVRDGHVDTIKLLDEGTPEYFMNERSGLCSPLHYAAISGSAEMVALLLEKGADPSLMDPYRRTSIGYAVHKGHHGIAQALRGKLGVDI